MDNQTRSILQNIIRVCTQALSGENIDFDSLLTLESSLTFNEWLLEWYNIYKTQRYTPASLALNNSIIFKKIIPAFENIPLCQMNAKDIQLFLNNIPYSNTRRKTYQILCGCFRKALILEKLYRNPMLAVELTTKRSKKRRAFEFYEQQLFIDKAIPKYRALFFFLCCTGLRLGEFIALTEKDFNTTRQCIEITKQYDARLKQVVQDTKTESSQRRIAYIDDLLLKTYELNESKDFFGTYTYEGVKDYLKRFTDKYDLKDVSTHSTRHTFASVCYFCNIPDKHIQNWLGHTTISMTMNVYTDLLNKGNSPIKDYILKLKNSLEI